MTATETPAAAPTETVPTVAHWIGGALHPSSSGRTAPVYDPALGVVTKQVALADQADVNAAVASAKAAFPAWRALSLARRTTILFKFRELAPPAASRTRSRSA